MVDPCPLHHVPACRECATALSSRLREVRSRPSTATAESAYEQTRRSLAGETKSTRLERERDSAQQHLAIANAAHQAAQDENALLRDLLAHAMALEPLVQAERERDLALADRDADRRALVAAMEECARLRGLVRACYDANPGAEWTAAWSDLIGAVVYDEREDT
jgi:hypothetical protein